MADFPCETVNARITSTMLGIEDHGMMTFFVFLEWNGGGQGLGGFALDGPKSRDEWKIRNGWGPGLVAIRRILETVGVEKWEDLKGKLVRAKIGHAGESRPPIIGHIIDDKWFDLQAFVKEQRATT